MGGGCVVGGFFATVVVGYVCIKILCFCQVVLNLRRREMGGGG